MKSEKRFYVYVHRRKTDDKIFYVGKGASCRARSPHGRSIWWLRIKNKHGRKIEYVKKGMYEPCSHTLEKIIIHTIGRENLCNLTDGGEGNSGITEENRANKSNNFSGKNNISYDNLVYDFYHESFGRVLSTKLVMRKVFKLESSQISKLLKCQQRYLKGWTRYEDRGQFKGVKYRSNKSTRESVINFVHESGELWSGPWDEFMKEKGMNATNLYKLRTGRKDIYKGWRINHEVS